MEVRYLSQVVGSSEVTLANPGTPRELLTIAFSASAPLPFRTVKIHRVSVFDRLPEGRCSHFHCVSRSDFQGFSFERWATNDGRVLAMRTLTPDGKTTRRVFEYPRDFDIATGFRHPQVLSPQHPHKVVRFLDLHTGEVTSLDQTLLRRWLQTNAGVAEPMIEIRTKWSFVSQKSVRWEAVDLPESMEMRIFFFGTSTTRLVKRSVTGIL
jgi:hypothetical protein